MKKLEIAKNNAGQLILDESFTKSYVKLMKEKAKIEEIEKSVKEEIQNYMELNNLKKIETEDKNISITYVEAVTNKEKFDKKTFKKEMPEIYDKFVTFDGKSKAYVKITNKF